MINLYVFVCIQNVWILLAADSLTLSAYALHVATCMYWHSLLYVIRSLGTVGQGVSCSLLQKRFRADSSPYSVRSILTLLKRQPVPLHTSLVKTYLFDWCHSNVSNTCNTFPYSNIVCLCSSGQKMCLIKELHQFEFFSDLLKDLGAEIALSMP